MRKLLTDLLGEAFDVVGEPQFVVRKGDGGKSLRGKVKIFPAQAELLENLTQRTRFGAGGR